MFASVPDVTSVVSAARKDPERAVLEGLHAVKHAVRFGAVLERVLVADKREAIALAARLAPDVVEVLTARAEEVGAEVFVELSPRPVRTGVVAIAERPRDVEVRPGAPVVLLEAPQDLGNVGACVRVAAAAGAGGVVTTGAKDPWSPEALRGSAGLHYAVPVLRGEVPAGRPLVALDPDGERFGPDDIADDAVLAFGTERDGLSDALKARADRVLALPMTPGVSSLNLATSVSAVLYAWRLGRPG